MVKKRQDHHHKSTHKTQSAGLLHIHEDVPAEHYDQGIKRNIFQKYWHFRRFLEVSLIITPTKGRVLDIGCHSGTFTEHILKSLETKKIDGIDVSPKAIKLAGKRIPYGKFIVADAANLPYKKNLFDQIFCLEMLEHVEEPITVIKEMHRVLKKGGMATILVPDDSMLFKLVWKAWTWYYPVWDHAHVQSFRGSDLDNLLKKNGFKINLSKNFNLGMLKLIVATKKN